MTESILYLKSSYLNKNISFLYNKPIIEYDLKSANTSLCREYNLLSEDEVDKLERMHKDDRVKAIGKMMRANKEFKEKLKAAFKDIRHRFFYENDIKDEDILSIKNDAIFCFRNVQHTDFGHCKFVKKNSYVGYMYINKLEIYYGTDLQGNKKIDVKGISDDILTKHHSYMSSFICNIFHHLMTSNKRGLYNYIATFLTAYKIGDLDIRYYREFNNLSVYRVLNDDKTYDDHVFIPYENKTEYIDGRHNFFIILEILKLLV